MTKIVILDAYTTNPGDLSWSELEKFGQVTIYDRTPPEKKVERAKEADIILLNKVTLDKDILGQLPKLKCISVLATGFNAIDTEAAKARGIPVCNIRDYCSTTVAQHVFAFLLALAIKVETHATDVNKGGWQRSLDGTYSLNPIIELAGKTMGIYGFGKIGQKVAEIAFGFDMKVIAHHKHPERDARKGVDFVSLERLFSESDVLTLHVPLTPDNQGVVNKERLSKMKSSAYLINTGRGGLIVETDLKEALENSIIAGAGLDVLSEEPPREGNILIGVKNCLITPHMAWASRESRSRLISETVKNVKAFLDGNPRNVVNSE